MTSEFPIASIHDALGEALTHRDVRNRAVMQNLTIRIDPRKKQLLTELCATHGLSPSEFLRACCDLLLRDYIGEKAWKVFESSTEKLETGT